MMTFTTFSNSIFGTYLLLIIATIYILFHRFGSRSLKLNTTSLFLSIIMYSRQNISINLNSIWAEDGLYFADLKSEGLSSVFSIHNGYQQIVYRTLLLPAVSLPLNLLPLYILILCLFIYFILIRELLNVLQKISNKALGVLVVFAFVWFPLSPYESLGNVNNLASYFLIVFVVIHVCLCYVKDCQVIKYSFVIKLLLFMTALSSPVFFIVLGLCLIIMRRRKRSLPMRMSVFVVILCAYNLRQFISLTESRFEFSLAMVPKLFVDSVFRLFMSPIAGKVMPDLQELFHFQNSGLIFIFLGFILCLLNAAIANRYLLQAYKKEWTIVPIAILALTTPSVLAAINAQSYLEMTNQHYRWALLSPGKFSSVSFLWIILILLSAQFLIRQDFDNAKPNSIKSLWHFLALAFRIRLLPLISFLGVLFFLVLNSHATGGRLPSKFSEDVAFAFRSCSGLPRDSLIDIPIAPYDGNWIMRIPCDRLK